MDIVERLRKNCTCSEVGSTPCKFEEECETAFDGADEIERLREALRSLIQLNDNYSFFGGELYQDRIEKTWDKARAALKEEA